jgi:hypothetical protein
MKHIARWQAMIAATLPIGCGGGGESIGSGLPLISSTKGCGSPKEQHHAFPTSASDFELIIQPGRSAIPAADETQATRRVDRRRQTPIGAEITGELARQAIRNGGGHGSALCRHQLLPVELVSMGVCWDH